MSVQKGDSPKLTMVLLQPGHLSSCSYQQPTTSCMYEHEKKCSGQVWVFVVVDTMFRANTTHSTQPRCKTLLPSKHLLNRRLVLSIALLTRLKLPRVGTPVLPFFLSDQFPTWCLHTSITCLSIPTVTWAGRKQSHFADRITAVNATGSDHSRCMQPRLQRNKQKETCSQSECIYFAWDVCFRHKMFRRLG